MRANVRSETVAAKKDVPAIKRVSLTFEKQSLWQPHNFVATIREPFFEMLLLSLPLRKTKIAANELFADEKPRIGRKHHVRQFLSRRYQFHMAAERLQFLKQPSPLRAGQFRLDISGASNPRINLVFDP